MRIVLSTLIPRPPRDVWSELERLEDHHEWMGDATAVDLAGDRRRGVGAILHVATKVGPLRVTDVIEVAVWDPPRLLAVMHRGEFIGVGAFRLEPVADGTRLTWSEHLRFPVRYGGPLGAAIARPILRLIWRANLRRLEGRVLQRDG